MAAIGRTLGGRRAGGRRLKIGWIIQPGLGVALPVHGPGSRSRFWSDWGRQRGATRRGMHLGGALVVIISTPGLACISHTPDSHSALPQDFKLLSNAFGRFGTDFGRKPNVNPLDFGLRPLRGPHSTPLTIDVAVRPKEGRNWAPRAHEDRFVPGPVGRGGCPSGSIQVLDSRSDSLNDPMSLTPICAAMHFATYYRRFGLIC